MSRNVKQEKNKYINQKFLFIPSFHLPRLPIYLVEVADDVPAELLDPVGVGVGRLVLAVDERVASAEEECPLLLVDVSVESYCHHNGEEQLVLLEESPARVAEDFLFMAFGDVLQLFGQGIVDSLFVDVGFDGTCKELNIALEGELVHIIYK